MRQPKKKRPIIYPVASGKGGTGKSTFVSNLGALLARKGNIVVIVDCDFGGSDLHLFLDTPQTVPNLSDYFNGEITNLKQLLFPTCIKNLNIICGGNEMVGIAAVSEESIEHLIEKIIELDADVVLIDLGGGTALNTLEFLSNLKSGILVCNPQPQSRVGAYGLLKNIIFRSLKNSFNHNERIHKTLVDFEAGPGRRNGTILDLVDKIEKIDTESSDQIIENLKSFNLSLILNRVRRRSEIHDINILIKLVREFLSVEIKNIGFLRSDRTVLESCQKRRLFIIDSVDAPASIDLRRITDAQFK